MRLSDKAVLLLLLVSGYTLLVLFALIGAIYNPFVRPRLALSHERTLAEGKKVNIYETQEQIDANRKFVDEVDRAIPALFMSWVVGAMANAAGVGGGAFFVPLFNIVLGFGLKAAGALSQAVIAGGSLASVGYYFMQQSPLDPTRPLIDFHLVLMLTPMMLFGVSVGVLLNVLFPTWVLTFMLTILLAMLTYKTFCKARQLHQREKKALAAAQAAEADAISAAVGPLGSSARAASNAEEGPMGVAEANQSTRGEDLGGSAGGAAGAGGQVARPSPPKLEMVHLGRLSLGHAPASPAGAAPQTPGPPTPSARSTIGLLPGGAVVVDVGEAHAADDAGHDAAHRDEEAMHRPKPWREMAEVLLLWAAFLALQLLKSKHPRCSRPYIAMFAAQGAGSVLAVTYFLRKAHRAKLEEAARPLRASLLKAVYEERSPVWSWALLIKSSAFMLLGGIISGLLGIGGGIIISPLLLELGVHPMVSAATAAAMLLFSASAAALSLGFDGLLNLQFALIFGLTCFASSIIAVAVVNRIVNKSGKASLIVMILATMLAIGCIMTGVFGGKRAIGNLQTKTQTGFGAYCN